MRTLGTAVALVFFSQCQLKACGHASAGRTVLVPRVTKPLHIDGELDDWPEAPARSGPFREREGGGEARPYSDARFLIDDKFLYVALYAADEDIEAHEKHDGAMTDSDAFHLRLATKQAEYSLDVAADGAIADARTVRGGPKDISWESGAIAAIDRDGTLNDNSDDDEEWVVELAIPLRALDLGVEHSIGLEISRCDTPKSGERRCGAVRLDLELQGPTQSTGKSSKSS